MEWELLNLDFWSFVYFLFVGLVMYVSGELSRAEYMDFGKYASGFTHGLYKAFEDDVKYADGEFPTQAFISLVFGCGSPLVIFLLLTDFSKGKVELDNIGIAFVFLFIFLLLNYAAFNVIGWFWLVMVHVLFVGGFFRGHFGNRARNRNMNN